MKKLTPLLILPLLAMMPLPAHAISEACFPAVECDPGDDYYAGSCQAHIDTVAADCPTPGAGLTMNFSCDNGCYETSVPAPNPCPGGVMILGVCTTLLDVVDDSGTYSIWDGTDTTAIAHVSAVCPDGQSIEADAGSPTGWTCGSPGLWETDGTHVWRLAGRVGAGTPTPDVALDIENTVGGAAEIGAASNSATGTNAVAMGTSSTASGNFSLAVGDDAQSSGAASIAVGETAQSSGFASIAIGEGSVASGDSSGSIGRATTASGGQSFSTGEDSDAQGYASVAMGATAVASGEASVAMGRNTTASGDRSFAMGIGSIASGENASSIGNTTTAQANNSVVIGRYNVITGNTTSWVDSDPLFIIGNGASAGAPANAFALNKNGSTRLNYTAGADGEAAFTIDVNSATLRHANLVLSSDDDSMNSGSRDFLQARSGVTDYFVMQGDGSMGINMGQPNYTLDVAGPANLNDGLSGVALRVNGDSAIDYNGNEFVWGEDGSYNHIPNRVGIGISPAVTQDRQLYVYNSVDSSSPVYSSYSYAFNSGDGDVTGARNQALTSGSGRIYGSYNYGYRSALGDDAYGSYNYGRSAGAFNVDRAYGAYNYAYNSSSTCAGPDCGDAFGSYNTAGSSFFGTGVYGEGRYTGGHFVSDSGGATDGLGLYVENLNSGAIGAQVECTGNCTSLVLRNGNDVDMSTLYSGYLIIGSPGGDHLAIDDNEITAKSSANTSRTLMLNQGSDGSVRVNMAHNSYSTNVCRSGETLGYCSSLREKKDNIQNIAIGLNEVMKLRPVTFDWKDDEVTEGMKDLGFIAEEVEAVSPLLGEYTDGKLSSVKYRQMTAVLTKAIQEQQIMIDELKSVVCEDHPERSICQ